MDEFKIEKDGFEIVHNFMSDDDALAYRSMATREHLTRALPYDTGNKLQMPVTKFPEPVNEALNALFFRVACKRHEVLYPEKDMKECKTIFDQRRYWCRFMWYGWINEDEVMAILFLTQPGVDYEGGLRILNKDGSETNIDSYCNMGDLAIVKGGIPHYVKININKPLLHGRLTFFVNYAPNSDGGKQFSSLEEAREYATNNNRI